MKIYSWNMLYENKYLDDAFNFIRTSDFDIFCIQEVPDMFLERLRELPCNIATAVEYDYVTRDKVPHQTFSVILSKYPIKTYESIFVPNWFARPIVRERIVTGILRFLRIWNWTKTSGGRNHLLAWVALPNVGLIQVYSIHLTIHGAGARDVELETIFERHDPIQPTLLCGDLNIFDTYRVSVPSWFFGATLSDAVLPWRERVRAENSFAKRGLRNSLRNQVTHPATATQLDHILSSKHFLVKNTGVINMRYGSDHNPVFIEVI